jgi:hypothetical protein
MKMIERGGWVDWMARYSLLAGDYGDSTGQPLVVSELVQFLCSQDYTISRS